MYFATVIFILSIIDNVYGYRVFDVNGVSTILALENEQISIVCQTDIAMAYCGFIHPNGKRFSFSGLSLNDGHCAVNIKATLNDSGRWKCHIGKRSIGLEMKQDIELRVVSQIAAIESNVTAVHGKDITLNCVTTKEKMPLSYCRFEPPTGTPFSIDWAVKPTKAIMGKYYFPQNKSLDRGDCSVTIHKVKYSDVGVWTCGAGMDDGKEYTDFIRLEVEGLYTMSTASTTGITFGTIGIIIVLVIVGFMVWKRRTYMNTVERQGQQQVVQELAELRVREPEASRIPLRSATPSPVSMREARSIPVVTIQSPSEPSASPIV